MADFLITVGVEPKVSYENMRRGISSIVRIINKTPPKIKIDIDPDSIKKVNELKEQLKHIQNTSVNPKVVNTDGIKKATSAYDAYSKSIREYFSVMTKFSKSSKAIKADITSVDNKFVSKSGNYTLLANELNRVSKAYADTKTAMASLPTEQQTHLLDLITSKTRSYNLLLEEQANKTTATSKANRLLVDGSTEYYSALKKIETLSKQIGNNSQKWTAARSGKTKGSYESYVGLLAELQTLEKELSNGGLTQSTFNKRIAEITSTAGRYSGEIISAGKATQSFSDKVADVASRFSAWFGVTAIIMNTIRICKQMVSAAIEIEDSMAQLKIVTGATDRQMEEFLSNSIVLAKELGKSVTDIASSIETFSRLGYSLGDASELAKYANILSNVAAVDTETATTGLTSIIKGYGMDVSEAEHVADVLVQVGQKYAISAEELMAAFQRGGAALFASGTDFEKSAALFAATNASLQNAESVGTMWKTVSARIRGATTELSEMGEETDGLADGLSKYREEILNLTGVDIMLDENTYKDMYNIFVELASVWDKMRSDEARARVAEILGGTRQLSGIMSTITNIKDAVGAYEDAVGAAGTATKANNIYMETTSAHIEQMKASFQELSANVVESSTTKFVIDSLRTIIEMLNTISELLGSVGSIGALGGTSVFLLKFFKAYKDLKTVEGFADLSKTAKIVNTLSEAFPRATAQISLFRTTMIQAGGGVVGFTAALKTAGASMMAFLSTNPVGWLVLTGVAFAGVTLAISGMVETLDEAREVASASKGAYQEAASEVTTIESELSSVKSRMLEIEAMGGVTVANNGEYAKLVEQNEQLERQLSIKQKLAGFEQEQAATDALNVLGKKQTWHNDDYTGYGVSGMISSGDYVDKITALQEKLNQKKEEQVELEKQLEPMVVEDDAYERTKRRLELVESEVVSTEKTILEGLAEIDSYYDLLKLNDGSIIDVDGAGEMASRIEELYRLTKTANEEVSTGAGVVVDYSNTVEELKTSISVFSENQSKLNEIMSASTSATGLSAEHIEHLISTYGNLKGFDPAKLFEETAHGVHVNAEELGRLIEQYDTSRLRAFRGEVRALQNEINNKQSLGEDTSALEEELEKARLLEQAYVGMTSAYNEWVLAQSAPKERDSYEGIGGSYDDMKEILDQGWYGDETLNKYLDLLLSVENRTGDAIKDFKKLDETISGTSHSLMDYWKYDSDDKLVTDGLFDFLDDVNKVLGDSYAKVGDDGHYQFNFDGAKLKEVADAFGTSTEVIELFERAMIDAGMAIDLSDKTAADFKKTLDSLNKQRAKINIEEDKEGAAKLDKLIAETEKDYYFRVDVESDGKLNEAAWIVERIKQLTDPATHPSISVSAEVDTYQLRAFANLLASLPEDIQIAVGVEQENVGSVDGIIEQLNTLPDSIQVPVNYVKGEEPESVSEITGIVNYEIGKYPREIPKAKSKVDYSLGTYPTKLPDLTQKVITQSVTFPGRASGTAYANGTAMSMWDSYRSSIGAYSSGQNWALQRDESALINELGQESIVRDGRWFLIPGGAHIEQLKRGDIVFSAAQTNELLKYGRAMSGGGHGRVALANGTAYNTLNMSAYDSGSGGSRRPGSSSTITATTKTTYSYSSPQTGSHNDTSSSGSDFKEKFDWIEVAITRIHEAIERVKLVADSAYRMFSRRNSALSDEIAYVTSEIDLQGQAYHRYLAEANNVGLDEKWAALVRNGAIDISTITNEALMDQINAYKEYYDKAVACKDAVSQLRDEVSSLYKAKFDNIVSDFDSKLSQLEHLTNTYNTGLDKLEAEGYISGTKYYSSLIEIEQNKISLQKTELAKLSEAMAEAVNSGKIDEGSEAWYDMKEAINEVKEGIQQSELSIIEFNNAIRDVNWELFDLLQSRLENITSEADFLIDLLSHSDLFKDGGQLTDKGMATMGLHSQNYNMYMHQADKYGEEVKKLNAELANDPRNQTLIDRRNELLELQQESILSAEDEKDAMVDLVEEGINLELESLKELIDAYEDSLDSAKDLYDYQKRVREQTSEISSLQKQLSAYSGDTSEETRATIQKLEVSLSDAIEELETTQYERSIEEQKKLLDGLYTEYETVLNKRLDNVDVLIRDLIEEVNSGSSSILDTIESASDKVGYSITDSLKDIWSSSNVVAGYGDSGYSSLITGIKAVTSIEKLVSEISSNINAMLIVSNALSSIVTAQNGSAGLISTGASAGSSVSTIDTILSGIASGEINVKGLFGGVDNNTISSVGVSTLPRIQSTNVGDVTYEINIPIDHVDDYNDLVNKLRSDDKFERFIQAVTLDKIAGKSTLSKNKIIW